MIYYRPDDETRMLAGQKNQAYRAYVRIRESHPDNTRSDLGGRDRTHIYQNFAALGISAGVLGVFGWARKNQSKAWRLS